MERSVRVTKVDDLLYVSQVRLIKSMENSGKIKLTKYKWIVGVALGRLLRDSRYSFRYHSLNSAVERSILISMRMTGKGSIV